MPVLTMKESKFGAPEGIYIARFNGLFPMKDDGTPRLGKDGKPMAPGYEWQFQITEGPCEGQIVGRITSKEATKLNACGTLLRGLVGRTIEPGDEVDPDQYIGQLFQIVVEISKTNADKTYVTKVIRLGGQNQAPAPSAAPAAPKASAGSPHLPASPAATPRPPAPQAPPRPPAPPAAAVQRYWVQRGEGDPELLPTNEVQTWLEEAKIPAEAVAAMPEDQQGGWKTLKDFGFQTEGEIPF